MIDCSKTENYLAEKRRMTKKQDGICKLNCTDCPLSIENNGTSVLCSSFDTLYPQKSNRKCSEMVGRTPAKNISK